MFVYYISREGTILLYSLSILYRSITPVTIIPIIPITPVTIIPIVPITHVTIIPIIPIRSRTSRTPSRSSRAAQRGSTRPE